MACTFCNDQCCSYGVDIDAENAEKLLAMGDDFKAFIGVPENEWFTDETFGNDFVELYNRDTLPVNVSGATPKYFSHIHSSVCWTGGTTLEMARRAIEAARFPGLGERPVTVTIGVAEYARREDIAALLARADRALYAGKASGRNRVVLG
jgi:hypothetical protein